MNAAQRNGRATRILLAPDDPLDAAARAALRAGLELMRQHQPEAMFGAIEPLHQMRVATRRLRAVVELFANVIHGSRLTVYRRDLQWLGRAAGTVRECDVIEALIKGRADRLGSGLAPADALAPLLAAVAERRTLEHQNFLRALNTRRYARLAERLAAPLLRRLPAPVTVGEAAAVMLQPIAQGVVHAGERIGPSAPPEHLHRLRVRIKRLRYALEMFAPLGGKRHKKALGELEAMQEALGLHQDAASAITWLSSFGANSSLPAPALMALGALLEAIARRRHKLAERGRKDWRQLAHSGIMAEALAEIAREAERRRQPPAPAPAREA